MVERLKAEHNVDVEWRPFYLYFDTPPEGKELPEYIKRGRAQGSEERLRQMAESYGMKFVSVQMTRRDAVLSICIACIEATQQQNLIVTKEQ